MTLTAPTATPGAPAAVPAHRSVPPRVRAALAVTAAAVAFAPSLSGLVADLRYGAPTGDLLAVPVVAAVMLDATVRSGRRVWSGRLGHGDLVAAGGLVAAAFVLLLIPAGSASNGRWLTRLDLLAHPLALAAFAVLLLGMRALAVAVVPLAYGLLVWPWPVTWLNVHAVAPLARATYEASGHAAQWLGAARMVDVGAENTLRIGTGERAFEVVVAPACSGITGIAAYLVVAGAVLALSHGRLRARLVWLGCGVAAVWVANVVRVTGLAVAGDRWGAPVALDLLHPVAGLALDAVVVVVLVASMQRFGLRWTPFVTEPPSSPQTPATDLAPPSARSLVVRGGLVAALSATFLVTTLHVAGPADTGLAAAPRKTLVLADLAAVGGDAEFLGREEWSKVYFGSSSVWNRYRVSTASGGSVWVDGLVVTDGDALRAHDVLSCYNFHGAEVAAQETVRLDGRVTATRLVVRQADGEQWQTLWWEWPVLTDAGLRHERVTLFVGGLPPAATPAGAPAGAGARGGGAPVLVDPAVTRTLVETAERVVERALGRTAVTR